MKTVLIYSSQYGNTKLIASAIAKGIPASQKVLLREVNQASKNDLTDMSMLIVGSPTQGGRPTIGIQQFLDALSSKEMTGVNVTSFDTRFLEKDQKFLLRLLMKTIGYAAPKITDILVKKGGKPIAPPEGFIVTGKEGPLREGEIHRATAWAKQIYKT
jgi:flavodoxin